MRLKPLLLTILALLIVLPVAGLGLLALLGADRFRPWIEQQATAATGRALKLEGSLQLSLGLRPSIALAQVSFAGAEGDPPMLRARALEARVALLPLLQGQIDIERVRIDGLDLSLAKDESGRGNWELGPPEASGGGGGNDRRKANETASPPPIIRDLEISGSRISWHASPDTPPVEYVIDQLRLEGADPSKPSTLLGKGLAAGAPFTIEGEIGPLATLGGSGSGKLDLRLTHGQSTLQAKLALAPQAGRPRLQGMVTATILDLRPFETPTGLAPTRPAKIPTQPSAQKPARSITKLIPSTPLDFRGLQSADAEIAVSIAQLLTRTIAAQGIEASIRLEGGKLEILRSRLQLAEGEIRLQGTLSDTGQGAGLALDLAVDRLALGELLTAPGTTDAIDTTGDLRLKLDGRGTTVAALAASLEGQILASLGEGRLKAAFLDRLMGGGRNIAGTLFPGKGDDWIAFRCGAFELPIRAGQITVQAAALDTQLALIDATGKIDLGQELLDLQLTPSTRATGLELAIPVTLTGSLGAPEIGIAKKNAAARTALSLLTGSQARAVAFDPARFAAAGMAANPCVDPTIAPAVGTEPAKPKEVLKDLKQGLEGLLGKKRR